MIYWISTSVLIAVFAAAGIVFIKTKKKNKRPLKPELTEWDRKLMAFHEAGHAVCSYYLPEREPMIVITIDPSSQAFGMIRTKQRLHHNETRVSMTSTIATLMGGRIAEEMFCNAMTTSCIYDLNTARIIASDMVLKFGMGEKSGLSILNDTNEFQISDQARNDITGDIRQIMNDAVLSARDILDRHKKDVADLAELLLFKQTITEVEINKFFQEAR